MVEAKSRFFGGGGQTAHTLHCRCAVYKAFAAKASKPPCTVVDPRALFPPLSKAQTPPTPTHWLPTESPKYLVLGLGAVSNQRCVCHRLSLQPPSACAVVSATTLHHDVCRLFPLQTPFRRGGYSTPVSKLGPFLNLQSLTTLSVRLCICSSKHQFCPSNPISNQTRRNNCSPFLTPSTKHHNTSDEPNPLAQSLPQYILCIQSSTSF